MKKYLLLLLACFSMISNAKELYVAGLTEQQVAQLQLEAANMRQPDKKGIADTVRTEAQEWGELGTNVGKSVVSAAKEIGVAANDFATTPLGKITIAIVVYKIIGSQLLHTFLGFSIFGFGSVMSGWIMLTNSYKTRTYTYKPALFGLYQKKQIENYTIDTDYSQYKWCIAVPLLFLTYLISLIIIF